MTAARRASFPRRLPPAHDSETGRRTATPTDTPNARWPLICPNDMTSSFRTLSASPVVAPDGEPPADDRRNPRLAQTVPRMPQLYTGPRNPTRMEFAERDGPKRSTPLRFSQRLALRLQEDRPEVGVGFGERGIIADDAANPFCGFAERTHLHERAGE